MNEPHIPAELNALDELASAIVDGEAVLPADANQALIERVAAMRTARALLPSTSARISRATSRTGARRS